MTETSKPTVVIKPIGDASRQPKALPAVPRPSRKTRKHCAFCRKVRETFALTQWWRRPAPKD